MYKLTSTLSFEEDVRRLDRPVAKRILDKLEHLANNPSLAKPVQYLPKDLQGLQKYRVGDWRVFFWLNHKAKEIVLYGVKHRSLVYNRFRS